MTLFALLAIAMVALSYLIVAAIAAACVYLPYDALASGRAANFQILTLFVGGVVVAGAILWSLVPRRLKFEAPGLLLGRDSHPKLFREIDGIAAALGEPVPREVYLVGQVNAFVTDHGGVFGIGSRRVLGIGLPLLAVLNLSEFRALLAHEFAHYYGGDTRLGPWVYSARSAMARTFENVGRIRDVGRIAIIQLLTSVVTVVLKWLFVFFMRVTNFVSRRQEYRADELAGIVAGRLPLAESLRKIHGASMAWRPYWESEIARALDENCLPPIAAGFAAFVAAPHIASQMTEGVAREILGGKSSPYDTHPPLKDRLEALARHNEPKFDAAQNNTDRQRPLNVQAETASAMSLFDGLESTEQEFVELLNPKLRNTTLRRITWKEVPHEVTIRGWRASAAQIAAPLEGITVANLPDAISKLPAIGAQLRDPQGMLLSPDQRTSRAAGFLAQALGLALVDSGWKLEDEPGIQRVCRDGKAISLGVVGEIWSGQISREDWVARCDELGITGLSLSSKSVGEAATN